MFNSVKIVLLAGKGSRFKNAGFNIPKPIIKFRNQELSLLATNSIPKTTLTIFGIQKKDEKKYNISNLISSKYENSHDFYYFDQYTKGQATSAAKIINNFKNKIKGGIFILSCDFSFNVDQKLLSTILSTKFDALVFTTKPTDFNFSQPEKYGWIRADNKKKVIAASCKSLILPFKKNDKVIIGAFYFRTADLYLKYYKKLIVNSLFINNETYIDAMIMLMIKDKLNIYNYEVNNFLNFGSPEELSIEKYR